MQGANILIYKAIFLCLLWGSFRLEIGDDRHFLIAISPPMDPISVASLVSSMVGIGDIVTRTVHSLSRLQTRLQNVELHISLLIGQLMVLNAALRQISYLTAQLGCRTHQEQFILDLSTALQGCESLVPLIEMKIKDFIITGEETLQIRLKCRFIWNEHEIKEYLSHLGNQIAALQLLLTALQ